ncbi:uncharacterized protein LOC120708236 isoform X2 [Panicum virgatum]|uniref:uncharacterized protein LOC120708236 isoform X2 n=1 Tax=Panicum virgatum TaxID=38727 RepID=UPI0019D4FE91|nr:uncharacterized protein LOC120708236 isoform X2 [Panicum virgatum]
MDLHRRSVLPVGRGPCFHRLGAWPVRRIEGIVKQLATVGEHEKISAIISLLINYFTYLPQANHRKELLAEEVDDDGSSSCVDTFLRCCFCFLKLSYLFE